MHTQRVVRRWRASCAAGAVALLAAVPHAVRAQTVDNDIAWVQLFHEQRLSPRWALFGDAQLRRSGVTGAEPQQLLLRPGILYTFSPRVRVGAGYAWVGTARYGQAPAATPFPEHRTWQQLLLSAATGPVAWQARFRMEQRWLGQTRALTSGEWEVTDWTFRQRFRPMVRATVNAPAVGLDAPALYLTAWDELFVHVGEQVLGRTLEQNRASVQLGWRFSPRLRVEAGYFNQFIWRGAPRVSENNTGLLVTIWTVAGAP